jgi:hypothetical protein
MPKKRTRCFARSPHSQLRGRYRVPCHRPRPLQARTRPAVVGESTLSHAGPWLRTDALGRRLIESHAGGLPGARKAMAELMTAPEQRRQLAQSALAQMRFVQATPEMIEAGMDLAVRTIWPRTTTFVSLASVAHPAERDYAAYMQPAVKLAGRLYFNTLILCEFMAILSCSIAPSW